MIYQLKISLQGIRPMIWRRIQILDDTTLAQFHHILQNVMGWENCNLHQFLVSGKYHGVPEDGFDIKNEQEVQLSQLVNSIGDCFEYEYDFGDSWMHLIRLEKIKATAKEFPDLVLPLCIAGKRACPPEDCVEVMAM